MQKLKNMKIGSKLTASYTILIAFYALSMMISLIGNKMISSDVSEFYNEDFYSVQQCHIIKTDLQNFAKTLARVALATENLEGKTEMEAHSYLETRLNQTEKALQTLDDDLKKMVDYSIRTHDDVVFIQQLFPKIVQLTTEVLNRYEKKDIAGGLSLAAGELDRTAFSMGTALNTVIADAQKKAEQKYIQTQNLNKNVLIFNAFLSVLVILSSILLCWLLTRSITNPLHKMEQAAKELAQGNLKQKIDYESNDELGSLAESLRHTIHALSDYLQETGNCMKAIGKGNLRYTPTVEFSGDFVAIKKSINDINQSLTQLIIQIDTSADQVLNGAEQIAGSGQALAQATLEQASSVEELSATINDFSERVLDNAKASMETSKVADMVGVSIVEGSKQMQELSTTMISLRAMSGQITGIIKDIEDIAFQTNILSLNAAVEAARAGEAGRGFSVVADEIRRLSAKTSEASKSTRELINQTVDMMIHSADMAGHAAEKLMSISEESNKAADKVVNISRTSNEQASAIVQLRESITQISSVVQENSATAEESAASSEELTGQMQMLKKLVGTFEYNA